jgi:hypothetical protein
MAGVMVLPMVLPCIYYRKSYYRAQSILDFVIFLPHHLVLGLQDCATQGK